MGRVENIEVYEDTKRLCTTNEYLKKSILYSTVNQQIILENDVIKVSDEHKYDEEAKVIVSKKRSFEAAKEYKDMKVCVHNFASSTTPGGGVVKGSSAQEECLCRTSTLYFCINDNDMWEGFYKPHRDNLDNIHNGDCIYTPKVVVMKTDTARPLLMEEKDWYEVDVITLAAPKLRGGGRFGSKPRMVTDNELLAIHEKRLRRLCDIAKAAGDEVLILGAFGCGAYMNSPNVAALAAKSVINDYMYDFKVIEFAVYCPPQDDSNYRTFERVLRSFTR